MLSTFSDLEFLDAEEAFLDPLRDDGDRPRDARAVIIPYGLEASVSYGGGTSKGPAAILAASHQLELYDDEIGSEAYKQYGLATVRPPAIPGQLPAAMQQLAGLVGAVLDADKFPLVLGGEHSLTAGAIRPFAERFKDLVVLQLDAHADLRDGYLGEHYSHASAMRRVLDHDNVSVVSVGIRAVSSEEVEFYNANRDRVTIHWAKDQASWSLADIVEPLRGRPLYVTIDIDGFDSALMPATGTPTPGGLGYWQGLSIVKAASEAGTIVGGDVVELAPLPSLHACDYLAASVTYKLLNYALSEKST